MGKYIKGMEKDKLFYEEICKKYYIKILKYCNAHLGYKHEDLAEVCAQNTFLQALINIKKLETHPNIGGWLYKTAENFVKRTLHDIKKEMIRYVSLDNENINIQLELACTLDLDNIMDENFDIDEYKHIILSKLTEEENELYREYYVEKKGLIHIINKYSITESAAKSRIFRLKKKINKIVKQIDNN